MRVIRACHELGIESVVTVSTADRQSLAAKLADRAICIGPPKSDESYLNQSAILAAALGVKADAIHPGYGFLAENSTFVQACEDNGIIFIGPRAESVQIMGDKLAAREVAKRFGVSVLPGSRGSTTYAQAVKIVEEIGLPVLFKAAAGGGGRGIRIVHELSELKQAFESATAEARAAFGNGALFVERYVVSARHIEVQVFGDCFGGALHLGERDCSLQRRYQKIVEEAPSSLLPLEVRDAILDSAVTLVKNVSYQNAGTVEFVYDRDREDFYFLEMNTRIQVEHPVTEAITGIDLVQLQLEIAAGKPLPFKQSDVHFSGHAIECRINAESPEHSFRPSPGRITVWQPPKGPGIRLDTQCFEGYTVPPFYDSLLAKLVIVGNSRIEALMHMREALLEFQVGGIDTNIDFLSFIINSKDFETGNFDTRWVESNASRFRSTSEE